MKFAPAVILLCMTAAAATAQSPAAGPAFEAASIKPAAHPDLPNWRIAGGPGTSDPGQFRCVGAPLQPLIGISYSLKPYQLVGPPAIERDAYDIVAKVPAGATRDQFLLMIRNLLSERFGMTFHWETREMPVYELVVAKGGSKLKEPEKPPAGLPPNLTRPLPPAKDLARDKDGFPILPPGIPSLIGFRENGGVRYVARMQTLDQGFLANVEALVGRPVVDKTGLTGVYDFNLFFRSDPIGAAGAGPAAVPEPPSGQVGAPDAASEPAPGLFEGLESQLGLKLESKKGPVEVLVVDKVNRMPTEN
jgi:uncharacterized protein (TIGR03435 family)